MKVLFSRLAGIRTAMFDIGGVLISNQLDCDAVLRALDPSLGRSLSPDRRRERADLLRARMGGRLRQDYDLGRLDDVGYWRCVAEAIGAGIPSRTEVADVVSIETERWSRPDVTALAVAAKVKEAGVRVGVFSNAPAVLRRAFYSSPWGEVFDYCVFSCDIGMVKPDASAFAAMVRCVNTTPSEILFVDDKESNVQGAASAGIRAYLWNRRLAAGLVE